MALCQRMDAHRQSCISVLQRPFSLAVLRLGKLVHQSALRRAASSVEHLRALFFQRSLYRGTRRRGRLPLVIAATSDFSGLPASSASRAVALPGARRAILYRRVPTTSLFALLAAGAAVDHGARRMGVERSSVDALSARRAVGGWRNALPAQSAIHVCRKLDQREALPQLFAG